jgi:signal transduction histidine kinase
MRVVRLLIWCAGGAFSALLIVGAIDGSVLPTSQAIAGYGVGAFFTITIGLLVWELRPESRTGILVAAIPFAGMLNDLNRIFPSSRLAVTIGWGASYLAAPLMAHAILSYPSGRLTSRLDRICVALFYGHAAAYGLLFMLFYSPRSPIEEDIWSCPSCAVPYTHVDWLNLIATNRIFDKTALGLALVALALLVRKILRAAPGARPVVLPLAFAACFIVAQYSVQIAIYGHGVDSWTHPTWFWITTAAPLSIPVALAAGLLWRGGGRGPVASLVVELERTPPGSVRDALARALGDPSLELALWLPERRTYVDAEGREVTLPEPASGRAVTVLGPADAPVAALVHDSVLLERRGLLTAAGAAARLALENERLQAELRVQLAELRASRARIVAAGDDERRRLERDLHDGAQQRLLSLGLALQLVRSSLGADANGATELLGDAEAELGAALEELRQLAQGIHPAVLTEHGLGAALKTLAARSPLPVEIGELPRVRLPAPVEAAAYFVVSEALANAAKHAQASVVTVDVACDDGSLVVKVKDDGRGGAEPRPGSGLAGLADRVHALEGRLTIESEVGRGTRLRVDLPYASVAAR